MAKQSKTTVLAVVLSILSLCCSVVCVVLLLARTSAESTPVEDTAESIQYVMYVGTNDKDTYQPKHSQEEARNIVDQVCLKYFEGYTLQEATGAWTDETSQITTLGDLDKADVDMFCIVIIGNSQTYVSNGRMITPRGYRI